MHIVTCSTLLADRAVLLLPNTAMLTRPAKPACSICRRLLDHQPCDAAAALDALLLRLSAGEATPGTLCVLTLLLKQRRAGRQDGNVPHRRNMRMGREPSTTDDAPRTLHSSCDVAIYVSLLGCHGHAVHLACLHFLCWPRHAESARLWHWLATSPEPGYSWFSPPNQPPKTWASCILVLVLQLTHFQEVVRRFGLAWVHRQWVVISRTATPREGLGVHIPSVYRHFDALAAWMMAANWLQA
jgi:hypothetical protein